MKNSQELRGAAVDEPTRLSRRRLLGTAGLLSASIAVGAVRPWAADGEARQSFDIVVYGASMAGVAAAIQAQRMGCSALLISETGHVGGMTTSGLGWTDLKWADAIGGISREFYRAIFQYYRFDSSWNSHGGRSNYQAAVQSQAGPSIDDQAELMYNFEPSAAQTVVNDWLGFSGVQTVTGRLDRARGVSLAGKQITSITLETGATFSGGVFVDATYEGDLMAASGVPYRVGRDSATEFGESLGGVVVKDNGQFGSVSPYVTPHDPASGYLPAIDGELSPDQLGAADPTRVQAYCYRLCLSSDPANQLPIEPPAGYSATDFELLLRFAEYRPQTRPFTDNTLLPNFKLDANNGATVSFDLPGGNRTAAGVPWPEASYADRDQMAAAHRYYQQGFLWTVRNHVRIPATWKEIGQRWSLAADEFTSSGGWPPQIYVREGRRMIGMETITESDQMVPHNVSNSIGFGTYAMDSHPVRRVVQEKRIFQEGSFYRILDQPWQVPFGAIVPRRGSISNLVVPTAISASKVALGSARMEPTYMVLGQSAATAAVLALTDRVAVQDVNYTRLRPLLAAYGQRLTHADRGRDPHA